MAEVQSRVAQPLDSSLFETGGLSDEAADSMIENVIGKMALPLSVVPEIVINNTKMMVPMSTEEPSIVAACSSIGKLIAPYSFHTSSSASIMIGQVHLPKAQKLEVIKLLGDKPKIIKYLN